MTDEYPSFQTSGTHDDIVFRWNGDTIKGVPTSDSSMVPMDTLGSLSSYQCFRPGEKATIRRVTEILGEITSQDPEQPVLLDHRGVVMQGHAQICMARAAGKSEVLVRRLSKPVPPDQALKHDDEGGFSVPIECPQERLSRFETLHTPSRKRDGFTRHYDKPEEKNRQNMFAMENGKQVYRWDVRTLWNSSTKFPIESCPIESITSIDVLMWKTRKNQKFCVEELAHHLRKFLKVDTSFPILLFSDGSLIDGAHRIARAMSNGEETVKVRRFTRENMPPCDDMQLKWNGIRMRMIPNPDKPGTYKPAWI